MLEEYRLESTGSLCARVVRKLRNAQSVASRFDVGRSLLENRERTLSISLPLSRNIQNESRSESRERVSCYVDVENGSMILVKIGKRTRWFCESRKILEEKEQFKHTIHSIHFSRCTLTFTKTKSIERASDTRRSFLIVVRVVWFLLPRARNRRLCRFVRTKSSRESFFFDARVESLPSRELVDVGGSFGK